MEFGVIGKTPRELDQFFTRPELASECIQLLTCLLNSGDLTDFDTLLEPACGEGAFIYALSRLGHVTTTNVNKSDPLSCEATKINVIAMDIDAKDEEMRQDFLQFTYKRQGPCLTIGTPPFGKNGVMAVKFFNKAAEFSKVIAFIVPRSFYKKTIQDKLDSNFFLVQEYALPKGSFIKSSIYSSSPASFSVHCVFQVWTRLDCIDLFYPQVVAHQDKGELGKIRDY